MTDCSNFDFFFYPSTNKRIYCNKISNQPFYTLFIYRQTSCFFVIQCLHIIVGDLIGPQGKNKLNGMDFAVNCIDERHGKFFLTYSNNFCYTVVYGNLSLLFNVHIVESIHNDFICPT